MNDLPPTLMTMPGTLTFTAQGTWLHDGEPVTHQKIARYFSKHLRYREELSSYVIEVDGRCVAVTVEDTPWVVSHLVLERRPWLMVLNSGEEEPFLPETLEAGAKDVLYCRSTAREATVRLSRATVQQLAPFVRQDHTGGYVLVVDDVCYPIRRRE